MNKWYNNISDSEKRLLQIGTVLIGIALFWTLVFLPINKKIETKSQLQERLLGQLNEMKSFEISDFGYQTVSTEIIPDDTTFSSWVDQQMSVLGIQELVNRTEPIDNNTLVIWLSNVTFDQVIDWLQNIHKQYGIQVDQIDVNVTDSALGLTNIRMRLIK